MKKRRSLLTLLLALALVLSLLPAVALTASASDLPALSGMKISAQGVVTWNAYPGAYSYYIYSGEYWGSDRIDADDRSVDFGELLRSAYAPSGDYTLTISAENDSYGDIAIGEVVYHYVTDLPQLPKPTNLRWDGYTARWDDVPGAVNGYYVLVREKGSDSGYGGNSVSKPEYDYARTLINKETEYYFEVYALGCENGSQSEVAVCSNAIPGRFLRGDLSVSLSGDRINWPPYKDSEGNDAWKYYVGESGGNPAYLENHFFGTSVNLRRVLELQDAPAGTYEYSLTAKSRDEIDVSKQSNTVTYDYVPEARTAVDLTGYETNRGYLSTLCLYGMEIYSYHSYSCTVGAEVPILLVPSEHYVVEQVLVCCGGEEREGGTLTRQPNGTYYGSFTVPDGEFTLKAILDYDYEELSSVSATFSEAPGQHTDNIKITGDGNCRAYKGAIFNSNERLGFSEYLLPGDSIRMIVKLYPEQSYQRFTMDTKVQINGKTAEILRLDDDGRELYCAYDFTVQDGTFTLEPPSDWEPMPNLKVSDEGVVTWDTFPGAAYYYIAGSTYIPSGTITEHTYDLGAALRNSCAPSGWYTMYIQAESEEWHVLGESYAAWYYSGPEALETPKNLRWDGYTARWDPVEGADHYLVRAIRYPDGYSETEEYTTNNYFDFSDYAEEKQFHYVFRVMAAAEEGRTDSVFSPLSAAREGRFVREPLYASLDGDVLRWTQYTDTEGNPAAYYYLSQYDGPSYLNSNHLIGSSIDLRDLMELRDADDGEYRFGLSAYSIDGVQVSDYSDEIVYNYTSDTRTTVHLENWIWEYGYIDSVLLNGVRVWNYDDNPLTAGELYTLAVQPREHYVLEDVALRYGDEDHYDAIDLKRLSDGSYTCRFRAPDQDFKLYFKTNWDWVDMNSARLELTQTPGARMNYSSLTDPDGTYDIYLKTQTSSDSSSIYGADYLLPGQEWQITFKLRPREQWERFGTNPTVTVNGKKAEVIKRSEDGKELYVRYDFTVAGAASVKLEAFDDSRPALENVKISDAGVVTWDAYPGANRYYVYHNDNYGGGFQDERSFDLRAALEKGGAPSGWYSCIVAAEDDNDNDIAYGALAWYYNGKDCLDTPANLRWDGYTARWDPVEDAKGYFIQVVILNGQYCVLSTYVYDTSIDLSDTAFYQDDVYAFRVFAYGDDIATSSWSPLSKGRLGRFRLEDLTVSLDGDVLRWPEYIDTEGNPADHYYIYQSGNDVYFNSRFYGTALNLRQALEMVNAPSGDYTYMVYAEEKGDNQVSEYSNEVVYHYVDQPRSTVKAKIKLDWNCKALVNQMYAYNGDEYALTVGKQTTLELRPNERYRAKAAYLLFDGDDRQEITLTEGADRISTGSFTVPDKDFTLVVESERVYEKLHSLAASFSEAPGYLLAMIDITPEDATDWTARISGLTGPHGGGNANLRPGGEYEAVVDFYIQGDNSRFADDVAVRINGAACTPESADGSHVTVRYTFTVSAVLDTVTVRGVTAPVLEAQPRVDQSTPEGVYYSIVSENEVSKRWYYNDGGWKWMAEDEAFRDEIAYILQLEYAPSDGCTWAENIEVQVEDVDPACIESVKVLRSGEPEGSHRTVEIRFKPLTAPKPVETAACTIVRPVEGEHPDMAPTVLDAEKYTVTVYGWYWDMQPGVRMTADSVFEAGGNYTLRLEFRAKDGFYFTEDTVFTVNGQDADSRYGTDLGMRQIDLIAEEQKPDDPTPGEDFRFDDVRDESQYYYDPVYWAVDEGITTGTSPTTFSPNNGCTRAQVVTFLWRAAGKPEPTKTDNPFSDVKSDAYYYKAVLWAVEKGITTGTSATTFRPDTTCTRGQIVTFLWRFNEKPEPAKTDNPFTDVPADQYYYKAVLWAVEKGVTKGTSADKFSPNSTCTRAQIVTFLYRATK